MEDLLVKYEVISVENIHLRVNLGLVDISAGPTGFRLDFDHAILLKHISKRLRCILKLLYIKLIWLEKLPWFVVRSPSITIKDFNSP